MYYEVILIVCRIECGQYIKVEMNFQVSHELLAQMEVENDSSNPDSTVSGPETDRHKQKQENQYNGTFGSEQKRQ